MSRTVELLPGESLTLRSGITIAVPLAVNAIYPTTVAARATDCVNRPAGNAGGLEPTAASAGTFGGRLREGRALRGITQEVLAFAAGVNQGDISRYESGLVQESTKTAQLAHALGCEAYWLATGEGTPDWAPRSRFDAEGA